MASTAKKYARRASNAGKQSSRVGLSLVLALAGGGYAGYRWLTDEEEEEEEAQQLQYASLADCVADWGDETLCQLGDDDKIRVEVTGTPTSTGSTTTSHSTHRTYYSPWFIVRSGSYFYGNDYSSQPTRGNVASHNASVVSSNTSGSNSRPSSSSTVGKSSISTASKSTSTGSISRGGFGSSAKGSSSS